MTERKSYPSDLTDNQWSLLATLVPKPKPGGRPPKYPRREILNAILYIVRTGSSWRQMPHDLPHWLLVYLYFRAWRHDGTWDRIHNKLRSDLRVAEERHRQPSAAILDSQSIKTTEKGGSMDMTPARKSMDASDIL
jgi:putative transposase